jgi:hypothetical protein
LNANLDFSFEHHYLGTGDWSNITEYRVDVSNTKRDIIPEKDVMTADDFSANKDTEKETHVVKIDSIKRTRKPQFPV